MPATARLCSFAAAPDGGPKHWPGSATLVTTDHLPHLTDHLFFTAGSAEDVASDEA
jgi:hypothetical protein